MSVDSDMEIDTNLLNTDNPVLLLGQDVATSIIVEEGIKKSLKYGGTKLLATKAGKKAAAKVANTVVSKTLSKQLTKVINFKITQKIAQRVTQMIIKMLIKTGTKQGAKIAAGMAAKAATVTAVGCAGGPVGCAAGAAAGAVLLAFDAMNLIMGVMDTHGYQIVFNQDFIDGISSKFTEALDQGFSNAGIENFFDEEILFTPEKFLFNTDTDGSLVVNEKWGPIYNKHIDDYMKTKNVKPGWRDRMETEELKDLETEKQKKKNTAILLIVGVVIILILLFLFSSGNSNNNSKK